MTATRTSGVSFLLKTGWIRTARFCEILKFFITSGPTAKICGLSVDVKLTPVQLDRIKGLFSESSFTVEALAKMAPRINDLPKKLAQLDEVAISSRFKTGGVLKEGGILGLNLKEVMRGVEIFESGRAGSEFSEGKTLYDGEGAGVGPAVSETGTILDVEYRSTPGDLLLKFVAENMLFLPKIKISIGDAVKKREGEGEESFIGRLMNEVGLKNVGKYLLEVALAREMFKRGELPDWIVDGMLAALKGGTKTASIGIVLKRYLRGAGSEFLSRFEEEWLGNIRSRCGKLFKKLNKAKSAPIEKEGLAILTLAVHAKIFDESRVLKYVRGGHDHNIDEYLNEVRDPLTSEEERIVTLTQVINILIG